MQNIFTIRFNEALKNSGMKQTELARRVNVSKQTITDYKSGKALPSIQTLKLLAKNLDCSTDFLLGLSDI